MAFPVEVAFSITFHKCQGLTLERVVICAQKRVGKGGTALTYETTNGHVRFTPTKSTDINSHLKGPKSSDYFNGEFDPISRRRVPTTR